MFAYNYFVWHSKMGISVMKMPKAVMMDFKMYFSRRNIDLHSKERHIWNSYELCGMHSVNSDMKKVKSCAHHYSDINWIELNCLNFSLNKIIQLSYYGYNAPRRFFSYRWRKKVNDDTVQDTINKNRNDSCIAAG